MVLCVRSAVVRADATALARDEHSCGVWSAPQNHETVPYHAAPAAVGAHDLTALEPTSPYSPWLRRSA